MARHPSSDIRVGTLAGTSDTAAAITQSNTSTSEKIRRLKLLGMRNADIARTLGIRDQFVSNVLRRAKAKSATAAMARERLDTAARPLHANVQVGKAGRVVIPAAIRSALGIGIGDTLLLQVEDGQLRVLTPPSAIRQAQELLREYLPVKRSLADELVAERRHESERE
jgi:AbrB family looped-hinge helix DNA binding protein